MSFQNGAHRIHGIYLGDFEHAFIMNHRWFLRDVSASSLNLDVIMWLAIIKQLTISLSNYHLIHRFGNPNIILVPTHAFRNHPMILAIIRFIRCIFISVVRLIQLVFHKLLREWLNLRNGLINAFRGLQSPFIEYRVQSVGLQQIIQDLSPETGLVNILQLGRTLLQLRQLIWCIFGQISQNLLLLKSFNILCKLFEQIIVGFWRISFKPLLRDVLVQHD